MPASETLPDVASSMLDQPTGDSDGAAAHRGTAILSMDRAWRSLAQHSLWAMALVAGVALAVEVVLAAIDWPVPRIHDEFSYLLAGDTFAHARLTNPTPRGAEHFETFHVILQPSYASKYPPGQGLLLALGQVLTGQALAGVWLSTVLAAVSVAWMVGGWLPRRWSVFAGLLTALHAGIQLSWGHSYWGGNLALAGAAIVYGAVPRLVHHGRGRDSVLLGLGAVILAVTRPFEGFVACACAGVYLLYHVLRRKQPLCSLATARMFGPALLAVTAGIGLLGVYNMAVTGSPSRMPYSVHESQYGMSPLFAWQSPQPSPGYQHDVLRDFHEGWELDAWRGQRTLLGALQSRLDGTAHLWAFFYGGVLSLPLFLAPRIVRDCRLRFAWCVLAALLIAAYAVTWILPHYFAPAAPLLLLILVGAVRRVRGWTRSGWPVARFAPWLVLAAECIVLVSAAANLVIDPPQTWAHERVEIERQLAETGDKHLVLVGYEPEHNVHQEWVYNRADLAKSPVVWARSMNGAADEALASMYPDRRVWRLHADAEPLQLLPGDADREQLDPFTDESPNEPPQLPSRDSSATQPKPLR